MSDPNRTPPDRVLTPTLATSAVHGISTLDPQPEDQPKENFSRITISSKQETESTDNQQEIETDVSLASRQGLHDHQTNMLETGLSESFEAMAIEYSGTSDSDPGSGSDMDSMSDDEDSEDQATDEFVRTVTAHRGIALKDVLDSHNLETGDMEAIDPSQCNMEPASLPLVPSVNTEVIFENSYFQVKRSQLAGWGAFAIRRLEKGDKILVEKPLFTATNQSLFDGFSNLSKPMRAVAYSLHANSNLERIKTGPIETLIWKTNAFSTDYEDSEAGLFPIASRFNHACNPMQTVDWHYNYNDQTLEMVVQADVVKAGEELTISYDLLSPLGLYDRYGFKCSCGGCPGLPDEVLAEREKRQW